MAANVTDDESTIRQGTFDYASYNNIPMPRLLYKYFKYNNEWTQRIFKNNEIYFAAPKDFNDPFDSVMKFEYPKSPAERERFLLWVRENYPHILGATTERQITETVRKGDDISYMETVCEELAYQMQNENAVFCMTEKKDNILMWAHYADQHTGFCLEFENDNPFFSRVRPVIYRRCLPKEDLVKFLMSSSINPLPLYLVTKAEDWAYEKEWRLAEPGTQPGQRKYPPESLMGVIFGCRTDDKNREQIKQWCRERDPRPILYKAKEKRSEFGLDIIPISY